MELGPPWYAQSQILLLISLRRFTSLVVDIFNQFVVGVRTKDMWCIYALNEAGFGSMAHGTPFR